MKYAVIERHRDAFPVRLMCRVLDVSSAGYYASRRRPASWHAVIDDVLRAEVWASHAESGETYGAPRVLADLQEAGLPTSQKRVARLMREEGLVGRRPKAWRVITTDAAHADPIAPNLLAQSFAVDGLALNQVWVGDITYVPTRAGFLYLATVLDLASRKCIGWAMHETLETPLVQDALRMACATRTPAPGCIFHSDRGSQYASAVFRAALAESELVASMSGTGNCYDNAVAESFFSTLEFELIRTSDWHTHADARYAIFRYIEGWYNRRRRHSTLGYVSPVAYEAQLLNAA